MLLRNLVTMALLGGVLAACGADGAPTRPDPTPEPGITMSGQVKIGITGRG